MGKLVNGHGALATVYRSDGNGHFTPRAANRYFCTATSAPASAESQTELPSAQAASRVALARKRIFTICRLTRNDDTPPISLLDESVFQPENLGFFNLPS